MNFSDIGFLTVVVLAVAAVGGVGALLAWGAWTWIGWYGLVPVGLLAVACFCAALWLAFGLCLTVFCGPRG